MEGGVEALKKDLPRGGRPPTRSVAGVSAADRSGNTEGQGASYDLRQLRNAQASSGKGLAEETSAFPYALHANIGLVAQYGRASRVGA